jgi:hypothetical protein
MCDGIASPSSTFSAWAEFFTKRPLLPIGRADEDLTRVALIGRHLLEARVHGTFGQAVS